MWYCIAEYYPPEPKGGIREALGSYWTVLSGPHRERLVAEKHGARLWRAMYPSVAPNSPELIRIKVIERVALPSYGLSPEIRLAVGLQSSFLEEA